MAPTFIGAGDSVKLVGGEAKPRWNPGAMEGDGSKQTSMRGIITVLVVVMVVMFIWLSVVTSYLMYDRFTQECSDSGSSDVMRGISKPHRSHDILTETGQLHGEMENNADPEGLTRPKRSAGGLVGPAGHQGPKGDRGSEGPTGHQGARGPRGTAGTSANGSKGERGSKGDRGAIGPQGPQGPQGIRGYHGSKGAIGSKGTVGRPGTVGPKGDPAPGPGPVIGFYAEGTHSTAGVLIFNHTKINQGGHYNATTGKFTTPVRGWYMFSHTFTSDPKCGDRYVLAGIGTSTHGYAFALSRHYTTSSGTAVIPLETGEQVWIGIDGTCTDLFDSRYYNTFSGFLVQRM